MGKSERMDVAVIGAGMTGLTAARALAQAGRAPVVFEKSRGLGGRIATRRRDGGLSFDHGALCADARNPGFAAELDALTAAGAAAPWDVPDAGCAGPCHVGLPGMSGLVKPIASGLDIRLSQEVQAVRPAPGGLTLDTADGARIFANQVVCAVPAPQAARILAQVPGVARALDGVRVRPCYTLLAGFGAPLDTRAGLLRPAAGPLETVLRNSTRPGRDTTPDAWVAHATAGWSRDHLELDRPDAARLLYQAFAEVLGIALPDPVYCEAHRWRYGFTETPLGQPCLNFGALVVAGDWCLGARIEDGYDSGLAAAQAILG